MISVLGALPFVVASTCSAAELPNTGRVWTYFNATVMLSNHWGWTAMPGTRFEVLRSNGDAKGRYFDELFTGPIFIHKVDAFTFKVGAWYYFMGFPVKTDDRYYYSHNFELLPIVEWNWKNLTFTDRVILHNTFHASIYDEPSTRWGWGTVVRELVQVTWQVDENLALLVAEEPFFGLIEDAQAESSSIGYWRRGLGLNRVYAGVKWKLSDSWTLSPQYVFETSFDEDNAVQEMGHYLYTTLSWVTRIGS